MSAGVQRYKALAWISTARNPPNSLAANRFIRLTIWSADVSLYGALIGCFRVVTYREGAE
jgi:hypothetical protein